MNELIYNDVYADYMGNALISSGAYKVNLTNNRSDWFHWKSGILAPVYCNTRQLFSCPKERHIAISGLISSVDNDFPNANGIIGLATAGIGWATTIGYFKGMPVGYIRSTPKNHGLGNMIEYQSSNKNILLIDDLIASGESIKKSILQLQEKNFNIVGVLSIINWDFKSMHSNIEVPKKALCSYFHILNALNIENDVRNDLIGFYQNPFNHKWESGLFKQ